MDERFLIFARDLELRNRLVIVFNATCEKIKEHVNDKNITDIVDKGRAYCDDEHKAMLLEYCHILPIHDILIASETRDDIKRLFIRNNFYESINNLTPEKLRMYIDDRKAKELVFG